MGGALAYCGRGSLRRFPWWLWPPVVATVGIALWATGEFTLIFEWLACVSLGVLVPLFREAPVNLLSKAAALVARYSYGIYLSHVPLICLCFRRLPTFPMSAKWLLFSALMGIVPVALYHLIEAPMIRVGKKVSAGYVK